MAQLGHFASTSMTSSLTCVRSRPMEFALLDVAEATMTRAGISDARTDLVRLAVSAMNNWEKHAGPGRFTGPASRGDLDTMEAHLRAIGDDAQVAEIYKLLADWIAGGKVATPK